MGYKLNGKGLPLDAAFTDSEGTQYPPSWLRNSSPEERAAVPTGGITYETVVDISFDPTYYSKKDTVRPLADVKKERIADQKRIAGTLLNDSDWLAIRAAEGGTAVPTAWATYRAGIRTKSKEREDLITACSDVPAVRVLVNSPEGSSGALPVWPTKPTT